LECFDSHNDDADERKESDWLLSWRASFINRLKGAGSEVKLSLKIADQTSSVVCKDPVLPKVLIYIYIYIYIPAHCIHVCRSVVFPCRRKLKADIGAAFPSLTAAQLAELVPTKEELSVVKVYAHRGDALTLYVLHRNPLFFQLEKQLYPTGEYGERPALLFGGVCLFFSFGNTQRKKGQTAPQKYKVAPDVTRGATNDP